MIDANLSIGVQRVPAERNRPAQETRLVVDANGAWSVRTALEASQGLAPFAVDVLEQPTPVEI